MRGRSGGILQFKVHAQYNTAMGDAAIKRDEAAYTGLIYAHWSVPLLSIIGPFISYAIGRVAFGHWPRASIDDPGKMSGFADVLAGCFYMLPSTALFATLISGIIGTPIYAYRRWGATGAWLITFGYSALWAVAYILLRVDPLRIGDWIVD